MCSSYHSQLKQHADQITFQAIALYCTYLFVLFMASFVFIPLLQMLAVTWGLTRLGKKSALSDYVPEARNVSTVAAFLWTAVCFWIAVRWPLVDEKDHAAVRFGIFEACFGSALAWLEASHLFNFNADAIGDSNLNGNGNVAQVSTQ